jgi:hypothetical protein
VAAFPIIFITSEAEVDFVLYQTWHASKETMSK